MATGTIKSNRWKTIFENQPISTALNYPSDFTELLVVCNEVDSNITLELLLTPMMKNSNRSIRVGYYVATNSFTAFLANMGSTVGFSYYKNGNQAGNPKISAYYR